jgi:polyphosphate kinase
MSGGTEHFLNRELSWLEFNQRVLDEASNPAVPLLERLTFLIITATNLDEFFMIRVGGLKLLVEGRVRRRDPAGLTPGAQLQAIRQRVSQMVIDQYACLTSIEEDLAHEAVQRRAWVDLDAPLRTSLRQRFTRDIAPVLTPLFVREDTPFPLLANLGFYVVLRMGAREPDGQDEFALVPILKVLPRLVRSGSATGDEYILIEEVIAACAAELVPGREILETSCVRITRNADISVDEEFASDLTAAMEAVLAARKVAACVRLEVATETSSRTCRFLREALQASRNDVVRVPGPIDLPGLKALRELPRLDHHLYDSWPPQSVAELESADSLFEAIRDADCAICTPFESFDPVVGLIEEAASDPDVLAIKQVLYRTTDDSRIVTALISAAEAGKYVTTLVELKARFDEANNLAWARRLERAGVHVVYGVKGLKTHTKILLIVRREPDGLRRYLHLGTGNYNETTATSYTDCGILTCDEALGRDASIFFNCVAGNSDPQQYEKLRQSPLQLRAEVLDLIAFEQSVSQHGGVGHITAKLNALVDPEIIEALYRASQAGVEIELIVRGICCLRPGVPGLSEHIRVISIVDRFLEHSRLFRFRHGGDDLLYLSSADWMPRNLDRRIELLVPIEDPDCKAKFIAVLAAALSDTVTAREMTAEGTYLPPAVGTSRDATKAEPVRSQYRLYKEALALRPAAIRQVQFQPHVPVSRSKARKGKKSGKSPPR